MKLLYIKGSPRGGKSKSGHVAESFLDSYRANHPEAEIDILDLWDESLPEFDGDKVAAKMTFFGEGTLEGTQKAVWEQIVTITKRFASADDYLFTVPMWNFGIPYRLKWYIDIIMQPGLLFQFDPENGYTGLLEGKRATVIFTSGGYVPGISESFGVDHHSTYFNAWLRSIGISDIIIVRYQPTLITADPIAGQIAAQKEAAYAGRA